jgi:hypothetical protein
MKTTTIKIEPPLIDELDRIKSKDQSMAGFVREVLKEKVNQQRLIKAAEDYVDFIASHPEEEMWLKEWEGTDLAVPPKS